MYKFFGVVFFLIMSPFVNGATLVTTNYIISISQNCEEGNVTCDDVTYIGQSKKSGRSITLKGHTIHRMCSDGVTPCEFLGYEFKNGNTTYTVLESGVLDIKQNGHLLLHTQGTWRD
ncbi:hypothetical protein [Celerinatantimonas diazotrophica]|nr:hypothetical protein [Celerinatantimonas diazotrophica]